MEFEFPKECPWCGSRDIVIVKYVSEYHTELCHCGRCNIQLARKPVKDTDVE